MGLSAWELPDRERILAGPLRTLRRTCRTRQRSSLCRACRCLGFQRAALLSLWALTTAVLIAVVLVLSTGSDHGSRCIETMAMACAGPAPGHSPDSSSPSTTVGQVPQQPAASIPQAGP
jgi:hypothetical protein